jgi:hypothetical protein
MSQLQLLCHIHHNYQSSQLPYHLQAWRPLHYLKEAY